MAKVLIYTAITGDYEQPRTDIQVYGLVEEEDRFKDPRRSARRHKCLTPEFWDYEYSLWIDGNTYLDTTIEELIAELGDNDILLYKHWRNDIYEEAAVLPESKVITEQINKYAKEGLPINSGLAATTYIFRRHTQAVEEFNNMWWAEICRGSERDQLSFNYVAWRLKDKVKVKYFDETHYDIHKINTNFKYKQHGL